MGMKNIISVLFLAIFLVGNAYAEAPSNWPWRGVALTSLDALPDDIALLKGRLRIRSVRISLDVRQYAQRNGLTPERAFTKNIEWADSMLDACRIAGVSGVLSINQFPIDPSKGFIQDSPDFWNNPSELSEVVRLVGLLAEHFNGRASELGAYEVLSEPLLRQGKKVSVPPQWPSLMRDIITEIRKFDPR